MRIYSRGPPLRSVDMPGCFHFSLLQPILDGDPLNGLTKNHGGGPVVLDAPRKGKMKSLFSCLHTSTSLMNKVLSAVGLSSLIARIWPSHFPFHTTLKYPELPELDHRVTHLIRLLCSTSNVVMVHCLSRVILSPTSGTPSSDVSEVLLRT